MSLLYSKKSWALKNWCFLTAVLEKTLESHLNCKEIQLIHPKKISWIFIGRTVDEAETPILWPPDAQRWFIGKDPDAAKDLRQEKGTIEDEMSGWHHWLHGHDFEQASGVGNGQEASVLQSLGFKESGTTVPELTDWLTCKYHFPGGSEVIASACNSGDLSFIPGLGKSPRQRNGNPLHYSCLENLMDGGSW